MKETKNKTLVIDADVVLYRACYLSEREIKWSDDIWTLQSDFNEAKKSVIDQIEGIMNTLDSDKIVLALSDRSTFRHDMWPAYKANRKDKRKPLGISDVKQWMLDTFDCVVFANLEADDVCGILCTESPETTVAVSIDKDFGTLPITWYNPNTESLRTITPEEANYFHLIQCLTGDATDGFDGLKGVGPKTAEKILNKSGATWETVVDAYEGKGLTEYDALMTARLARILRSGDYNVLNHKVTLWSPNSEEIQQHLDINE